MDNVTNKDLILLGVAVNKILVKRLYTNGMTNTEDLVKFTGLSEKIVERIKDELELD